MAPRWARYSARLLDGTEKIVEDGQSGLRLVVVAEGLDASQGALPGVVTRRSRRLVAFVGQVVLLPGDIALAEVKVDHGAAVALLEDLDRPIVAAQQVEADA